MSDDSVALRHRIQVLQGGVSELCRAAVRISASLESDAVLQEVVDSVRWLVGARPDRDGR